MIFLIRYFFLQAYFVVLLSSCVVDVSENDETIILGEVDSEIVKDDVIDTLKFQAFDTCILLKKNKIEAISSDVTNYTLDWNDLILLSSNDDLFNLLGNNLFLPNKFNHNEEENRFKLYYLNDSTYIITQKDNDLKVVFVLKTSDKKECWNTCNLIIFPYYLYPDDKNNNEFNLHWTKHIFYLSNQNNKIVSIGFGTTHDAQEIGFLCSMDKNLKPKNFMSVENNRIMRKGKFIYSDDSTKITGLNVHYLKTKSKVELLNIDSEGITIDNYKNKLLLDQNLNMYYKILSNDSIYEIQLDEYLNFKHDYDYKGRLFVRSKYEDVNMRENPYFTIYRYINLFIP